MALDYVQWSLDHPGKTAFDFQDAQRRAQQTNNDEDLGDDLSPQDEFDDNDDEAERQAEHDRQERERRGQEERERQERLAAEAAAREAARLAAEVAAREAERRAAEQAGREEEGRAAPAQATTEAPTPAPATPTSGPPLNADGSEMSSSEMIDAGIDPSTGQPFSQEPTGGGGVIPSPVAPAAPPSGPPVNDDGSPMTTDDMIDAGIDPSTGTTFVKESSGGGVIPSPAPTPPAASPASATAPTIEYDPVTGQPIEVDEFEDGDEARATEAQRREDKGITESESKLYTPTATPEPDVALPGEDPILAEALGQEIEQVDNTRRPPSEEYQRLVLDPQIARLEAQRAAAAAANRASAEGSGPPPEIGDITGDVGDGTSGVAPVGTTDEGAPAPGGWTPPTTVRVTSEDDFRQEGPPEELGDRPGYIPGDEVGIVGATPEDAAAPEGWTDPEPPSSSRTASAIPGDVLPTGDEDITSGAVSEHDQAIIDRKRELRGGVDFEDITSGAVESTPEGYEQHPSGLVVPTASAIPGDMKPTGDEDVTSGAVREQAMRTRAFGEDIRNMARNAAGFGQDYVYKVLHSTAVGAGQVLGAAHKPAWAVHDKITGQTSDKDPVARSYEQIGTIPEASKRVAEGYGLSVPEDHLLTKIPVIKDMPLLSLAPGQDLARAAEDRRIQGSEWIDAATAPIDVLPLPLATGIGQGVKAAKSVLPTKLGGGFIASTSPDKFVPRLMGSASDHAVLDASIDARRQLATTGEAKVTIGGQTYVVDQTRLDEALRKANPDRHLSTTAATDVSVFEKGGPVPTLYLPDGRVKPPAEQFQYRTLGGTGVLRFADDSALGHAGSKHKGLVVYGDDVDSLAIPGTRGTTLDTNYYAGGRELEGGVPTEWHRGKDTGFTPGETAPVRRATGIGGNKGLYLDENLENPSYAARVGANVKALADKAKTPFADSGPAVRRADADEIARGQFGKNVDELTETEAAYVKHAQMDDSALTNLAGQGDETAIQILDTRKSVQGALDDARDAARRDTGGYYQRDSGVYAPYSPPQGMPAVDTEDFATGDDSPATPRGEGVEGGDGVAATRSDSAAPGRRYEGEGGYDDGIDPETGLLREDFATGDSPAAPRDDGTVRDDGTGLDDGTVRSDDPDDDYGEGDLFGDDGTVRDDGTGLDDGTVRSDDPDDELGFESFGDDGTVREDPDRPPA